MKHLPGQLLAVCLTLLCLGPALAQEANRAARSGVVKISAQRSGAPAVAGSGFVIRLQTDAGKGVAYVLTAAHVAEGGGRLSVQFFSSTGTGAVLPASLVGIEGANPQGLALLKVEGMLSAEVRALPLAGDVELDGGEAVTAIGHPQAAGDWLLVNGNVSGRVGRVLQVQMPVRGGNSGGPLLMQGRVVGLVLNEIAGFAEVLPIADALSFARGHRVLPNAGATPVASAPAAAAPAAAAPLVTPPKPRIAGPKPLFAPYKTGDIFQECAGCPEMVVIVPDREFMIGSPRDEKGRDDDEGPFGPIRFAAPYAVGRFELTRAQFARSGVAAGKGCYQWGGSNWQKNADADWQDPKFPDGFKQGDEHPVVCVNWDEAQSYLKWLNAQRPGGAAGSYRLPSEAEWEYAARGNSTSARFWGDSPDDACKYANVADRTLKAKLGWAPIHECEDGHVFTAAVGGGQTAGAYRFRANAFGLYDMLGNAWEWTQDCYQASFDAKIVDGSASDSLLSTFTCDRRVLRGGSWDGIPDHLRSANRDWYVPGNRYILVGFRVARTLP